MKIPFSAVSDDFILSYPFYLCFLDGHDLHGHHRQHLNVYTVELIKAGPCAGTVVVEECRRSIGGQ